MTMARHIDPAAPVVPPRWRDWGYPILAAGAALGVTYGLLSDAEAAAWLGLGSALLGLGTATAYRPSRTIDGGAADAPDE